MKRALFRKVPVLSRCVKGIMQSFGSKVILVRHGQSTWNKSNQFTGWTDVPLTPQGIAEAMQAGLTLKKHNYKFDIAFTSVLNRSIETYNSLIGVLEQQYIPVKRSWRLNERHYGALQGLNKKETAVKYGKEQVLQWRRSYAIAPPLLKKDDVRNSFNDRRYSNIPRKLIPRAESLKLTLERTLPYWKNEISKAILAQKTVLIVAHGNSIRAIVKYVDKISKNDILQVEIPNGTPLLYEFDKNLKPLRKREFLH